MKYIVTMKRRKAGGSVEEKRHEVDAQSEADAMMIARKDPKNDGFYVWGVRKGE
jgi:hypothetical protein